jgi:uncharacterized protein YoxC
MKKNREDFSKRITNWVGSTQSLIVHTIGFVTIFSLRLFGFSTDSILLILTTIVSLEAIYLSIFIQITINQHSNDLEEVSEDIEELQENVEDISEDVEEIQKDVDEIQEDVEEISEDVEEIQEDVDEINEEDPEEEKEEEEEKEKFKQIENTLKTLLEEISDLKSQNLKKTKVSTKKTK